MCPSSPTGKSLQQHRLTSGLTARILLLLPRNDTRLLRDILPYETISTKLDGLGDISPDLIISDLQSLQQHTAELTRLKELSGQVILPLLVAVAPTQFGTARKYLGKLAEDVVRVPIAREELLARVDNLLRLRHLSIQQAEAELRVETRLAGSERAFRALSATNEHLVRAHTRSELLDRVGETLVTEGGYALIWFGTVDTDGEMHVHPVAKAGQALDYLDESDLHLDSSHEEQEFISSAVRERRTVVVNSIKHNAGMKGREEAFVADGIQAAAAIPMGFEDCVPYILCVYADRVDAFDVSERHLLERLAENVAYGLYALEESERRVHSEQNALYVAYHDSLTGIANREAAMETLDRLLEARTDTNCQIAVLFIDLDGFKLINDALGHDVGDDVLIEVARRLDNTVRDGDTVARHGGDEFLVIMNRLCLEDEMEQTARRVAMRLIDSLAQPYELGNSNHYLNASIGISIYPEDGDTTFQLLTSADSAMYDAKRNGGGRYEFFSSQLAEQERYRWDIEHRLREAVQHEQLTMAFQPVVELQHGNIIGVEALLRWPQADGSYISPAEFIPVAEETGLIVPIGEWGIEKTADALAGWHSRGYPMRAAVNLSTRQMWQNKVVEQLVGAMKQRDLPLHLMDIELTESALMSDVDRMEHMLHTLGHAGFSISIDDFGTGYSSLGRLKFLPIDKLKIDKGFLSGVPDNHDATTIVRSIIGLAHNLELEIIAEGVETLEQWEMLWGLGCEYAQGFYFGRAMSESEITEQLEKR